MRAYSAASKRHGHEATRLNWAEGARNYEREVQRIGRQSLKLLQADPPLMPRKLRPQLSDGAAAYLRACEGPGYRSAQPVCIPVRFRGRCGDSMLAYPRCNDDVRYLVMNVTQPREILTSGHDYWAVVDDFGELVPVRSLYGPLRADLRL